MSNITIDSVSFYMWIFIYSILCLLGGFIYGFDRKIKKINDSILSPEFSINRKIKEINDSILSIEKETLNNIIELLLYENIDEALKMGFIKEAIKEYLKKDVDRELRMKEPSFCMILQTTCNNIKDYYNCLECETYIHYRDIYLKEHVEE